MMVPELGSGSGSGGDGILPHADDADCQGIAGVRPQRPGWREASLLLLGLALALVAGECVSALVMPSTRVTLDILGRRPIKITGDCWLGSEAHGHKLLEPRPSCVARHRLLDDYDVEYRFDAHGLRGSGPQSPDGPRILVLGDSQTLGQGVPEASTFCARLSELLSKAGGPVTVMNAGVPGYGTFEQSRRAERLIPSLRPQLLLVTVFVDNVLIPDEGNDLSNNLAWIRAEKAGEATSGASITTQTPHARWPWLADHSHLYGALATARRRLRGTPDHYEAVQRALSDAPGPELEEVWNRTRDELRETSRKAGVLGVEETVLLYLPGIGSLGASDRSPLRELEKTGLPVVSAFERLRAAGDPRTLTYRHDAHYNARAHALIGEALAEALGPRLRAQPSPSR